MMEQQSEQFSMRQASHLTGNDREYAREMNEYFLASPGATVDKLRNFPKFVSRQDLARFLARYHLFQQIVEVHGYIIECGVFLGGGLMSWAQLSAIFEPVNHIRRIVGFDTFTGFPEIGEKDRGEDPGHAVPGGLATHAHDDLLEAVRLYDMNRPLGHIPRVELVEGDGTRSIPAYLESNPHLVVAMLYLDFDLYEPTRVAIETFLPRMPKGAILVFDELNQRTWPGETLAVLDTAGIRNLRIRRFPFTPQISYAVLE